MIHDSLEDVTESRTVDPSSPQGEAIALLELNPTGRRVVRLTLAQWRHVDRVVTALAARDQRHPAGPVPAPRSPDRGS